MDKAGIATEVLRYDAAMQKIAADNIEREKKGEKPVPFHASDLALKLVERTREMLGIDS